MMTVEQALEKMLAAIRPITDEQTVDIIDSLGRISAEDCIAESPVPSFARSAMDGYAVRAADIQDRVAKHAPADTDGKTRVVLRVAGKLLAGDYRELDYEPGTAVRVMTGAYIPDGYDAVVKQEDTDMGEVSVEIRCTVKPYENYCKTGENMAAGHIAVAGGTLIRPIHMGLLAAAGPDGDDGIDTDGKVPDPCRRRPGHVAFRARDVRIVNGDEREGKNRDLDGMILLCPVEPEKIRVIDDLNGMTAKGKTRGGQSICCALQPDMAGMIYDRQCMYFAIPYDKLMFFDR